MEEKVVKRVFFSLCFSTQSKVQKNKTKKKKKKKQKTKNKKTKTKDVKWITNNGRRRIGRVKL